MKTEICVPAGALAKGEEATTPGVGDSVEFTAAGTVSRVEGDNAYLTVDSVNGEPVMADDAAGPEAAPVDDMEGYVRDARAKEAMP